VGKNIEQSKELK